MMERSTESCSPTLDKINAVHSAIIAERRRRVRAAINSAKDVMRKQMKACNCLVGGDN